MSDSCLQSNTYYVEQLIVLLQSKSSTLYRHKWAENKLQNFHFINNINDQLNTTIKIIYRIASALLRWLNNAHKQKRWISFNFTWDTGKILKMKVLDLFISIMLKNLLK